ncbi:MAG: amino acid ABC transporter substrate-binding protein, partial [bacterium]|nr:amino acid ABC transporter substrate-binding protein [bacterium]
TERDLFRLVASGEAFALACDAGFALWILPDFEGLGIAGFLSERQEYGFVVPKESSLKPLLDQHLAELNADGSYRTWIRGIFGELGEVFLSEAVNQ